MSARLRPSSATLNVAHVSEWAVATLYSIDPPYNLFPSLHLSIAVLAALSSWKAARLYGTLALVGVGLASASVCTVKQHFFADALSGFILAALVGSIIILPYKPAGGSMPAYSWRGIAIFSGFLLIFYALLYFGTVWSQSNLKIHTRFF
jgi:PAP2 superfamily